LHEKFSSDGFRENGNQKIQWLWRRRKEGAGLERLASMVTSSSLLDSYIIPVKLTREVVKITRETALNLGQVEQHKSIVHHIS
jgi:hypothetical protein